MGGIAIQCIFLVQETNNSKEEYLERTPTILIRMTASKGDSKSETNRRS